MQKFTVIIPARLYSTRLPRKLLIDIAGKPMLQHVYERACESGASRVIIATDHQEIAQAAHAFGATVCLTAPAHASGSSRIAEAAEQLKLPADEIVVNVQGDEPLIPPAIINQVAVNLAERHHIAAATLCTPLENQEELFDPNIVKVVRDKDDYALYFSRAPIPFQRDSLKSESQHFARQHNFQRHIGLYAYRVASLQAYQTAAASELEQIESLEQLRLLWMGEKIHVAKACESSPIGVDTAADLEAVRSLAAQY